MSGNYLALAARELEAASLAVARGDSQAYARHMEVAAGYERLAAIEQEGLRPQGDLQ